MQKSEITVNHCETRIGECASDSIFILIKRIKMAAISEALKLYSPKASWNGSGYTNADTGVKEDNVFLIYQDTYIMGNPGKFMGATDVEVPEKYYTVK